MATSDRSVYAVIMAGGSGTRFWPASRRLRPKQLLDLGTDEPLLAAAVRRIEPLCPRNQIIVATGQHLEAATKELLSDFGPDQWLIEPMARNTAPCIGWAAATVARTDPDAVIMALPADPHILDEARYTEVLAAAIERARDGVITTIGIQPTHPETGYGYILAEPGEGIARRVKRFVEKPDRARAESFLADGNYFWNAGMFFFRAKDMLAAIQTHLPELGVQLQRLDAEAASSGDERTILQDAFEAMPGISIDHGVMEKMGDLGMVIGDFGWTDLGSWLAVSELADKDNEGNHFPPGTIAIDARNNYVANLSDSKPTVALVGVSNLVVVQTNDAVLVLDREQAQRVRDVVGALKASGRNHLL